ncbi:hypothetical protein MNBD_NITROSPINAE02-2225 [hydrothermal vent metagenome]|uniref:PDZ domain-containing protein n=1 Tax=hydrothermal vent metagenome TaxID=652676 RepID=A0A3B1CBP1_9ZZZZ
MGIRFLLVSLIVFSATAAYPAGTRGLSLDIVNKSVVKILSVKRKPSYSQPWQFKGQSRGVGTGVIIEGERILTNAHVVGGAMFIEIKKSNNPKKYIAYVEAVGHECDLAILKPRDKSFFDGTAPMELGELPDLHDTISVYGFPTGGAEISITEGIISRIEQLNYAHSGVKLLGAQIDAAVNPGNSGGPALKKDKIVGIAMQSLRSGDNIGYIIPTPIIKHFLKDIEDGNFDGFPDGGVMIQRLENEYLRNYYGLGPDDTGVSATKVIEGGSMWGVLKEGDVIVSLNGSPVANDGTVKLGKNLRVSLSYILHKHFQGETLEMEIIRDKERLKLQVELKKMVKLVPQEQDVKPSYYIYGGLIFMPLTYNYLREWGRNWHRIAPINLLSQASLGFPTRERSQVVFLSSVLAHEINAGYHGFSNLIVEKVNGEKIVDMKGLVAAFKHGRDRFTVIEMARGMRIALDDKAVQAVRGEILKRYGIPSAASKNLQ